MKKPKPGDSLITVYKNNPQPNSEMKIVQIINGDTVKAYNPKTKNHTYFHISFFKPGRYIGLEWFDWIVIVD